MTEITVNPTRKIPLGPGSLLGFRDGLPSPAQLTSLNVRIRLSGPLAAVEVRQTFHNPYPEALEFTYLFAWNEGASLSRFRAQVGERQLEAQPADDSPESQRSLALATLFENESAPVFSVGLGLLEPGQTAVVELFYAELAEQTFCFPLAPGPADWPSQASLQLLLEAPVARFHCNLPVRQRPLAGGDLLLELSGPPHQDLRLSWEHLSERPQAVLRQSSQHFLLQLLPPKGTPPTGPRDLVVLVDMSENATPERFQAAQRVARQWLEQLQPEDQFALVSFHHQIEGFEMGGFHPRARLESALSWLAQRRPSGRADLGVLLERVLSLPRHRELSVLLIACGPVGNEPELYARVCSAANPPPFHALGLSERVNASFLRRLEAVTGGGGTAAWLRGLSLMDRGLGAQPASLSPFLLPPLRDRPLTVLGRKNGDGGLELRGQTCAGQPWSEMAASFGCQNPALPMLWARQKVDEMLDELRLIQGPRASQLRQISQALCREYRLMTEISPVQVAGKKLPSLYPGQWKRPVAGNRPKIRTLPRPAPVLITEPPKVRAGLVPPQGSTDGLKAQYVRSKKYENKRKPAKPTLMKVDPLAQARQLLARDGEVWKARLRDLYRSCQADQLAFLLQRLGKLTDGSSVLAEIYRVGLACLAALRANHPQAPQRTAEWVRKFARLFA